MELTAAVDQLRRLRRQAALTMGLARPEDPISHAIPKTGVVGHPRDYVTTEGKVVNAADYDVSARILSMHAPHPLIGLTSVVAIAARKAERVAPTSRSAPYVLAKLKAPRVLERLQHTAALTGRLGVGD